MDLLGYTSIVVSALILFFGIGRLIVAEPAG